jgi:hypothetical protein
MLDSIIVALNSRDRRPHVHLVNHFQYDAGLSSGRYFVVVSVTASQPTMVNQ